MTELKNIKKTFKGCENMKVMQINAVYGVGSTGVIVEDLHNLSLKNGI